MATHLADAPVGAFALPLDREPMEALLTPTLPIGAAWQYESKWDGFRCLAFKEHDALDLRAKSGKPLGCDGARKKRRLNASSN
jgi:ATP-dependent DNA ligase